MKPTPKGWPRVSSGVFYEDPAKAIEFLCDAFGFECVVKVEGDNGRIEHSELKYGEGLVMVGHAGKDLPERKDAAFRASPKEVGGKNTQSLMVFVDDVDAHCAHARARGAKITQQPETHDYGEEWWTDRSYQAEDLEGHRWWFTQRMRSGTKYA